MVRVVVIVLVVGLGGMAAAATGQVWSDGFDAYTGSKLGTWAEYRGDWIASKSGRAEAEASFGRTGIPAPGSRRIPLALDPLLVLTVADALPGVFTGLRGVMDTKGDAAMRLAIPNLGVLKGVTLFTAFVNVRAGQIVRISNDHAVTIG